MTLDIEMVWKPYRFVGVHLLNQYIQAYEIQENSFQKLLEKIILYL